MHLVFEDVGPAYVLSKEFVVVLKVGFNAGEAVYYFGFFHGTESALPEPNEPPEDGPFGWLGPAGLAFQFNVAAVPVRCGRPACVFDRNT